MQSVQSPAISVAFNESTSDDATRQPNKLATKCAAANQSLGISVMIGSDSFLGAVVDRVDDAGRTERR